MWYLLDTQMSGGVDKLAQSHYLGSTSSSKTLEPAADAWYLNDEFRQCSLLYMAVTFYLVIVRNQTLCLHSTYLRTQLTVLWSIFDSLGNGWAIKKTLFNNWVIFSQTNELLHYKWSRFVLKKWFSLEWHNQSNSDEKFDVWKIWVLDPKSLKP